MTTLVLLSGGADSTTALAHALSTGGPAAGLFIDYGQRHITERGAARAVAGHYGVELIEFGLPDYGALVESSLTGHGAIPRAGYDEDTMASTVVHNRNAVLLSIAAGIAAGRGIETVATAVHAGDHFIYPDCRPAFIDAIDYSTRLSCGVGIAAPFLRSTKADIIAHGAALDVPYTLTWSCYEGGDVHCGQCGTCTERREAFATAGVSDPTRYAVCP